jgi:hypothetical protein
MRSFHLINSNVFSFREKVFNKLFYYLINDKTFSSDLDQKFSYLREKTIRD